MFRASRAMNFYSSEYKAKQARWASVYQAVLTILGVNGTILPLIDIKFGDPTSTTTTTFGDVQQTITFASAPSAWTNPWDPGTASFFAGDIPIIDFANSANEIVTIADDPYWVRGDGATDSAFSLGLWVKIKAGTAISNRHLFNSSSKETGVEDRKWQLNFTSASQLDFLCFDESTDGYIHDGSSVASVAGEWIHAVGTYTGSGSHTGMILYMNGVAVSGYTATVGSYTAMEDGGMDVHLNHWIGTAGTPALASSSYYAAGPWGPFFTHKVLSEAEVVRLYNLGRGILL